MPDGFWVECTQMTLMICGAAFVGTGVLWIACALIETLNDWMRR